MTWKEIKEKTKRTERIYIAILALILALGIVDELFLHLHGALLEIYNFDSVCLTLLSIQATVSTLVITILSLMTNKMDTSYMGVSINDFLLNIKPTFFKQKCIIISEIAIIIINAFVHMLKWYNVVVAIFVAGLFLVIISVLEIYEAFLGTEKIEEEINVYLKNDNFYINTQNNGRENLNISEKKETTKHNTDYSQKLVNFVGQWKKIVDAQPEEEYQDYVEVFSFLFSKCFETDNDRKVLLSQCVDLLRALFNNKTENSTLRGISFMDNCYMWEWLYINDHRTEIKGSKEKFYLFHEVFEDFINAFSVADIRKIDREFRWWDFVNNIIQNALFMEDYKDGDEDEEKSKKNHSVDISSIYDIKAVSDCCYYLGAYLSGNYNDGMTVVNYSKEKWGEPIDPFYLGFSIPEQLKETALESVSECYFRFWIAQIINGYYELIEKYWYSVLGNISARNIPDAFVYSALKIHCYIYYLAFYESSTYAEQVIIERARQFIENERVEDCFQSFIVNVSENDKNVFSDDFVGNSHYDIFNYLLRKKLDDDLRGYEFMASNHFAKIIKMDDATIDFVSFLSCFVWVTFNSSDILESIIPESDAIEYYMRYVQNDLTDDLTQFFKLMGLGEHVTVLNDGSGSVKTLENVLNNRTRSAYAELVDTIEKKYKAYVLNDAEKALKYTDEEYEEQSHNAENNLESFLKEKLAGLISDSVTDSKENKGNIFKRNGYTKLHVLRIRIFSDDDVEKLLKKFWDDIFIGLTNSLANKLLNAEAANQIYKKKYSDDQWIDYLEDHQGYVIIGSKYTLYPRKYKLRDKVKEWLDKSEHYTNRMVGSVLLVKKGKVKINFRNVHVEIRPENIQDAVATDNAKYDSEKDRYRYAPSSNMPVNFTGDELSLYLKYKRRIVDVSLEAGVEIDTGDGEKIGDVIKAE